MERPAKLEPLISQVLMRAEPVFNLTISFLFCNAVAFLYLARQYFLVAFRLLKIIVGEFSPLFLHFALELLPVAGYLIPTQGHCWQREACGHGGGKCKHTPHNFNSLVSEQIQLPNPASEARGRSGSPHKPDQEEQKDRAKRCTNDLPD